MQIVGIFFFRTKEGMTVDLIEIALKGIIGNHLTLSRGRVCPFFFLSKCIPQNLQAGLDSSP